MQLAEQEEEDLNRIKEESRRRRQAILEKHKNKQLQQQTGTDAHSEDAEKGTLSVSFWKVLGTYCVCLLITRLMHLLYYHESFLCKEFDMNIFYNVCSCY